MQKGHLNLKSLFSDLVRIETRLYNAVNDRLRAQHGLYASQFEFLQYLRDHPGSRVGELASFFAIGIGATSKGIDRLEVLNLVHRLPNPEDRRSSLLELTLSGAKLADAAERTFEDHLRTLIGSALDRTQGGQLAVTLARLRLSLEHDSTGTPAG